MILAGHQPPFLAVLGLAMAAASCGTAPEPPPIGPMAVLEEVRSPYGRLEVLEHHGTLALVSDGVFQTVLPASGIGIVRGTLIRGGDFTELIPYFRPEARSALLIGVGGGLGEKALALYGIRVLGIEIDPEVVRLASKHFGLSCEVAVADGREFLARDRRRFDAIILDAFLGGALPEHLFTLEAFELAAARLEPGGILAIHLIGTPAHAAIRAVARTAGAVFPHTASARSGLGYELQNIYLFASPAPLDLSPEELRELEGLGFRGMDLSPIDPGDAPLLTDNTSRLGLMSRDIEAEHRRLCLEIRRNPPW